MKFFIDYDSKAEKRSLKYLPNEYSFDTDPSVHEVNFTVIINKLNLTVDNHNVIIQIWGFCPYGTWIKANYSVPKYKQGTLRVIDDLEPGFAYGVNDDDWPIYVNESTGWVCVGDPKKQGNAVEFITNCVAVIDDNQELVSLWLKPQSLPPL